MVVLASHEGSALGAALLAMVGTKEYASVPEVCGAVIREAGRIEPDAPGARIYAAGYQTYLALYPALKPVLWGKSDE